MCHDRNRFLLGWTEGVRAFTCVEYKFWKDSAKGVEVGWGGRYGGCEIFVDIEFRRSWPIGRGLRGGRHGTRRKESAALRWRCASDASSFCIVCLCVSPGRGQYADSHPASPFYACSHEYTNSVAFISRKKGCVPVIVR